MAITLSVASVTRDERCLMSLSESLPKRFSQRPTGQSPRLAPLPHEKQTREMHAKVFFVCSVQQWVSRGPITTENFYWARDPRTASRKKCFRSWPGIGIDPARMPIGMPCYNTNLKCSRYCTSKHIDDPEKKKKNFVPVNNIHVKMLIRREVPLSRNAFRWPCTRGADSIESHVLAHQWALRIIKMQRRKDSFRYLL